MAREYVKDDHFARASLKRRNLFSLACGLVLAALISSIFFAFKGPSPWLLAFFGGVIPAIFIARAIAAFEDNSYIERERTKESERRNGKPVLGVPPRRDVFEEQLASARKRGKLMLDRYLVGFELETGEPMWISDDDFCSHGCVFAKTGVGKTLWLEGLMFQQMARGRASGFTFIDAKRDPGTLADIILMALITGRVEDLIVVDPFDPVCCYNFVFTPQRPDVKARKILRCGLPPIGDDSPAKHYDRLAADAVSRLVRALESFGLAWSVKDIAVALSAFNLAYPRLRALLVERGNAEAVIELGHLASTYRTPKGGFDTGKITENLRGIASELHSISNSEAGMMFCAPRADLSLTDAILRGKLIYYMLPRLEEAESADRMVKVFREDLEVSIGEITSNRNYRLEDPHMVIIDEGASTFGPTWANLFELARKGRFALFFGAQSVSGLMDKNMGLSEEFYQRVIANVNLKVIMRLGDNKTAEDMCEWIGKVVTTKRSFALGLSTGFSAHELTKHIEVNRQSSDTVREAINVSDDEDDLVSAEELKHEMSAEKGLAWFDIGDGRLRKGRSIWFDSALPRSWEGREYLVRYDMVEGDEIGLAEWVDQHIYGLEKADQEKENERQSYSADVSSPSGQGSSRFGGERSSPKSYQTLEPAESAKAGADVASKTGFRLNMLKSSAGKIKARISVLTSDKEKQVAVPNHASPASSISSIPASVPSSITDASKSLPEAQLTKLEDPPKDNVIPGVNLGESTQEQAKGKNERLSVELNTSKSPDITGVKGPPAGTSNRLNFGGNGRAKANNPQTKLSQNENSAKEVDHKIKASSATEGSTEIKDKKNSQDTSVKDTDFMKQNAALESHSKQGKRRGKFHR